MIRKINPGHIAPVASKFKDTTTIAKPVNQDLSFNQVLQDQLNKTTLQYSKHADMRMKSFGITKNQDFQSQLEDAAGKARAKNIKEGLILKEDYGFVVSIKNNTVITVVDLKNMEDNVFTNIDGAVII